jgi:hypothetical protein
MHTIYSYNLSKRIASTPAFQLLLRCTTSAPHKPTSVSSSRGVGNRFTVNYGEYRLQDLYDSRDGLVTTLKMANDALVGSGVPYV